ncbi:hypothetical protein [Microbulbifer sp. S227A]|uniref:hypothetical protein n=1 Tax=Microbulbifer sp. S227A TaxID=3415131 RepID=UPI003C7DC1AC
MLKENRIFEEVVKLELRKAVTAAWEAGYDAARNGESKDCEPIIMESIIGDAWDRIKKAVGDFVDAIGDWVKDKWKEVKKTLDDLFGDPNPFN